MSEQIIYQVATTANGSVGYCQIGSGPPLVLIVGYSGTLYHWNRHFVTELAKHYTVYLIDNRKIGASDSNNDFSMQGMAQDVIEFIAALQLGQPLLFGWSMGGVICQCIMQQAPQLVAGAGLLATIPHASYTSEEFINIVANSDNLPANEFRQKLYGMFFSENPREELKQIITSNALPIMNYHYRFTFTAKELQDYAVASWHGMSSHDLAQISVPVLIMRARDDRVVGAAASQFLGEHIPQAKTITYPEGGHFFLHRNPLKLAWDFINTFS
jgi:pimeloyl-ACP methyl ester carboxylesterase